MQVKHRRVDMTVPGQRLQNVKTDPGFHKVRGERLSQRVDRSVRQAEFLAGFDDEPLE